MLIIVTIFSRRHVYLDCAVVFGPTNSYDGWRHCFFFLHASQLRELGVVQHKRFSVYYIMQTCSFHIHLAALVSSSTYISTVRQCRCIAHVGLRIADGKRRHWV